MEKCILKFCRIVDSLWLKKEDAPSQEYIELCKEISKEIGALIGFEGRYRWIVFLPSKTCEGVPVLNRYYGVFENGKIKVRGVEARRRDTPNFIREAQLEMIKALSKAKNAEEFKKTFPHALDVLKKYAKELAQKTVQAEDLLITKQLSIDPRDYAHNVFQAIAAMQLMKEGIEISAGQNVRYLITDAENRRIDRRVRAAELIDNRTRYDVKKYLELLLSAGANILGPFGYNVEKLRDLVIRNEKQVALN